LDGLKAQPLHGCSAEEFARGKRREKSNPLRWDSIRENLPGDPKFDPSLPRVMKWDSLDDTIAGDVLAFVDDLRASAYTQERAWAISRQVASRLQYLGIQDVPRKRQPPVRNPGAWAGSVFRTTETEITQTVAQEKWNKGKLQIAKLKVKYNGVETPLFNYKRLEQIRGFLCHVAMTYTLIATYLKGFHLTLAAHHPRRDQQGWKLSPKEWDAYLWASMDEGEILAEAAAGLSQFAEDVPPPTVRTERSNKNKIGEPPPPPKEVKPVERLETDLEALSVLFCSMPRSQLKFCYEPKRYTPYFTVLLMLLALVSVAPS
jgi:hypothetical protein